MIPSSAPDGSLVRWDRRLTIRRGDLVVAAVLVAYAVLAVTLRLLGVDRMRWDGVDWVLYSTLAVATIAQFARPIRAAWHDPERIGWLLLGLSVFARFTYGTVWNALETFSSGDERSPWLILLKLSYLALSLPALLWFPLSHWRGRDAVRARIDGLTVIIGSALLGWFFAIGPLLRSPDTATAPVDDVLLVLGDALAMVLAARLHLRAARASTRAAAGWVLLGLALRIMPDIVILHDPSSADFLPFGLIDAAFFLVWAMLWAGARTAESMRPADAAPGGRPAPYVSDMVPHAFLLASVALLLGQTTLGDGRDVVPFAVVSAVLTMLLVTRQGLERDERDQLAQRLVREGARYEALLKYAYDAVVMFDRRGALTFASPATVRTFGPAIESRDDAQLWGLIHPDDREGLRLALSGAPVAGEGAARAIRLRARDRLGQWRTFEGHLHDHRADPEVGTIVLNGVDRTREARLAEGLAEAQPLEALGVLAGGLAHDLNNILTVVASHAELLDADAVLDARGRDDVVAIRAASDRALTLTRGLLTLSRRKEGPVSAIAIAASVRAALAGLPRATLDAAEGASCSVLADPSAVTQVLEGLLDAARHEVPDDALHLTVGEQFVEEAEATALGVEPRLYVAVTAGVSFESSGPLHREEAVRVEAGHEWDLAPGDLALLIALAACRELGGTVLRERQGDRARYAVLLPAVHQ